MRLFTVLALFMLPMTVAQFYSPDSYALTSESVLQKTLFDKAALPEKLTSSESIQDNKKSAAFVENRQAKSRIEKPSKTKRVKLMKGKRNTQGVHLLSFLLMLKDKSK